MGFDDDDDEDEDRDVDNLKHHLNNMDFDDLDPNKINRKQDHKARLSQMDQDELRGTQLVKQKNKK